MKRIVGSLCLLLSTVVAAPAAAGVQAYVTLNDNGSSGFARGEALELYAVGRRNNLGISFEGLVSNERKARAERGYAYSANVGLQRYYGNLFAEAGVAYGGYRSTFESGTVWERTSVSPRVALGYDDPQTHINVKLAYAHRLPRNEPSPVTDASSLALTVKAPLWRRLMCSWTIGAQRARQNGRTNSGSFVSYGLGFRF